MSCLLSCPFKERKEHELFKFGPSQVYTSTRSMKIPIVLGDEVKEVEASIVHANIPFLLGRDYLDKWNCVLGAIRSDQYRTPKTGDNLKYHLYDDLK